MTRPTDRYARYVRSEDYRRERARKARVVARLCHDELSRARRIADLGAGTGLVKKEIENISGKYLLGIELDKEFIEVDEGMAVGDVLRLPLPDGSLDLAILNHLYEHVGDQPRLFREVHRVLRPGGTAYVSAGSRFAVVEPHYRLPFLSWLPRPLADRYLRWTGRGREYRGIRFRTHRALTRMMREAGFRVEDRTAWALDQLLEEVWGRAWGRAWRAVRLLPGAWVRRALRLVSPQWFFFLRKPGGGAG